MAVFHFQDTDGAWNEFVEWYVTWSLFEYERSGFKYHQVFNQHNRATKRMERVFHIELTDEEKIVMFKLRWSDKIVKVR